MRWVGSRSASTSGSLAGSARSRCADLRRVPASVWSRDGHCDKWVARVPCRRTPLMVLGLLPAIRGGLVDLARSGQHTRLIDGYLRPYARAFDEVRYFSYHRESLEQYVADPDLGRRVHVFAGGGWHPWIYAFFMAVRHARALRGCAVFRVYQITGVIPAVIARRRWGTPFVTTYGFWYARLARSRATAFLRAAVETLGLRAADAVIVTTPELRAYVAARVGG